MARDALTVQPITGAGVAPTFIAAHVDGMSFPNSGNPIVVEIKNAGGTACVATFQTPGKAQGETITARAVTVPITTGDRMITWFPPEVFNQSDGSVYIDFSQVASVTIAVFSLPY
jgi:hypothetical protein